MKFVADDGRLFLTLVECAEYENSSMTKFKLANLISSKLETTYCEDFHCNVIEDDNVLEFIQNNWDDLCKIMNPPNEI